MDIHYVNPITHVLSYSLESLQHYNEESPYLNPKDHPYEREVDDGEDAETDS